MGQLVGFERFVAEQSRQLLRSAWLLTHDWHAAEDLVQTALLRTIPRWNRIERTEDPGVYVRKVMVNVYLTGRGRRWTGELPSAVVPDDGIDRDSYARADTRLALLSALDALPCRQRAVVVLRFFDDLSEAQTAAVLGCAVGTVKSQTARALSRLRDTPLLQGVKELS